MASTRSMQDVRSFALGPEVCDNGRFFTSSFLLRDIPRVRHEDQVFRPAGRRKGAAATARIATKLKDVMAGRAEEFRNKAAAALRSGRKAAKTDDRDAHFETAAFYKSLAHDEEWFKGERQRSYKRKKRQKSAGGLATP